MPLGAFRLNSISKLNAIAQVIRYKKSIAAVGNAQIDTAQSKFGGSSALFDGSGDYLSITPSTEFAFSGNFTIELWARPANTTGVKIIYDARNSGGYSENSPVIYQDGATFKFYFTADRATSGTITANTWYHLAVSKSGNDYKFFVNGTQVGSTYTNSATVTASTALWIGAHKANGAGTGFDFNGWVDELRVSKTARYTANFTAPTTQFTNDNDTILLSHMDGTDASTYFEDDNGIRDKKGIVAIGNAQIDTAQSKFGGSSALFDGTGDYLRINETSSFAYGSGDFTIEFWVRFNAVSGYLLWDQRPSGTNGAYATIYWNNNAMRFFVNGSDRIISNSLSTATWYHVAVSRLGTSTKMFINGTQAGSTWTDTTTYISGTPITIGADSNSLGSSSLNGWMDELRISNTARYTANFTAPTAPFVNDANTLLLIHMDGTDTTTNFIDDNGVRSQIGMYRSGGQISTDQSKFGGSSLYLQSAFSQYVVADKGVSLTDYTIEFWYRATTLPGSGLTPFINFNNTLFYIGYSGANTVYDVFAAGSNRVTLNAVTINTGTWYHVAFVRSGSAITVYHNGSSVTTGTWSTAVNWDAAGFDIGKYSTYYWNGYFDEIRISNTARYTANFTAPTAPFQNDANTLFLAHFDGTNGLTTFIDDNGKKPI